MEATGGPLKSKGTQWCHSSMEARRTARAEHAGDVLHILYPELQKPLGECRLLDLGCGLGTDSIPAARMVHFVVGVDVNLSYVERCRKNAREGGIVNADFRQASVLDLNEGIFDIVLCDYLLEHVEDADRLMKVIAAHLSPQGALYLTTNNRWWPIEGHYGLPLPFISYFPRPWADRYVRILRLDEKYSVYARSLSELTALFKKHDLQWTLKPPLRAFTLTQRIGTKLVEASPSFWKFANVFQVVGYHRRAGEAHGLAKHATYQSNHR